MEPSPAISEHRRVGLIYDDRMCSHATPDGEAHPENPNRIRSIWKKLEYEGITRRCVVLNAKQAKDEHVESVHSKKHVSLIRNISSKAFDSRRDKIASKFNSIYLNKGSSESAYLAAGSVVEVSEKVAKGDLSSAIAIVRPPGHHAEHDEAMGFCLFNNVAIAAKFLLSKSEELGIRKILIVDWDVHHGNGTQNMFYNDSRVLFFSVHRFDFGTFYPSGGDGSHYMIGDGPGVGHNINVPWEHENCGDADYIAVWDHVLIPVTEAYNPDIILVSAGFDAALGDPLGGCCVTPSGYSLMLRKLMGFAQGKIVMALEGGYNLKSIANSVLACAKSLLDENPIAGPPTAHTAKPFVSTWRVIQEVRQELKTYWPALAIELPQDVLANNSKPFPVKLNLDSCYDSDVENDEGSCRTICEIVEDVIVPLSKLNVGKDKHEIPSGSTHIPIGQNAIVSPERCHTAQALMPDPIVDGCIPWRSVLSKKEVWYGSYGSNMWQQRFLCYIEGGKVEGMNQSCLGARDKSSPKAVTWKIVPHRLFFGRSHTLTWGVGGVAFLHPESNIDDKTYMCMYKITLEQFNDVLLQENSLVENYSGEHADFPLIGACDLDFVARKKTLVVGAFKGGWYSNVLYLGEDNIPILTMTCSLLDVERFKSGELPLVAPSKDYTNSQSELRGMVVFDEVKAVSEDLTLNLYSKKTDAELFFHDKQGEVAEGGMDEEMEPLDAAFRAVAQSMKSLTPNRGRKRKEYQGEGETPVKFVKYRINDSSAKRHAKNSADDVMNSGSEADSTTSDEDMEETEH